jgi:hypothetical protein
MTRSNRERRLDGMGEIADMGSRTLGAARADGSDRLRDAD